MNFCCFIFVFSLLPFNYGSSSHSMIIQIRVSFEGYISDLDRTHTAAAGGHRRTGRGDRGAVDPPIRADTTYLFGQKSTHLFD